MFPAMQYPLRVAIIPHIPIALETLKLFIFKDNFTHMPEPAFETVLYVDDDRDDQEFFVTSLSEARPNSQCYLAHDSISALELIANIPVPKYIFIDLHLPRINGIELLKKLKAIGLYSSIPTYILSTSLFEPYERAIKENGGSGFLRKPASLHDFKLMLDSILV